MAPVVRPGNALIDRRGLQVPRQRNRPVDLDEVLIRIPSLAAGLDAAEGLILRLFRRVHDARTDSTSTSSRRATSTGRLIELPMFQPPDTLMPRGSLATGLTSKPL